MAVSTKSNPTTLKPRRNPGRPAGRKGVDLKPLILDAAIKLFGKRGFDGVSLSQIAGEAGSDVGLTRYYFGSKAGLWQAAMTSLAERFSADLVEACGLQSNPVKTNSQADTPSDAHPSAHTVALKKVIRGFVETSARWPQVSRIIVFDGDKSDARGKFIAEQFVAPFFNLLSEFIAGAKSEGALPEVSERTIFFMITHGASFPMALPGLTNALPGGDIKSPRGLKAHADAIVDLIFA